MIFVVFVFRITFNIFYVYAFLTWIVFFYDFYYDCVGVSTFFLQALTPMLQPVEPRGVFGGGDIGQPLLPPIPPLTLNREPPYRHDMGWPLPTFYFYKIC